MRPSSDVPSRARLASALQRRAGAIARGRTPGQALHDLAAFTRSQGVRATAFRSAFEAARMLAPPGTSVLTDPPAPAEPRNPPIDHHAYSVAMHPFYNLDPRALGANREIVGRFGERPSTVRTTTWFVPYFEHVFYGGIHTILRFMSWARTERDVEHRIVFYDEPPISEAAMRRRIAGAFPALSDVDIVLPPRGTAPNVLEEELPPTDVAFCTLWYSAYPLARFNATKAKFYFVQDFEPAFYPAGTLYGMAEATYRFGFAGLVNTPGLEPVYAAYGNPAISFVPAVDVAEARRSGTTPAEGPVRIAVYGRPGTDRNGFELLAASAVRLKARFGDGVEILSAGEDWDPATYGLGGILENLGRLPSKEAVHEFYKTCDVGLCFMFSKHPSYQPLEYLAAGAAVVTNVNSATSWLLRDQETCLLTEPIPDTICDTVGRLVVDADLRARLAGSGLDAVAQVHWDQELAKLWRFVTGPSG